MEGKENSSEQDKLENLSVQELDHLLTGIQIQRIDLKWKEDEINLEIKKRIDYLQKLLVSNPPKKYELVKVGVHRNPKDDIRPPN